MPKTKNTPTAADLPSNAASPKDACELLDADHIAVKHLFVEYARLAMASQPAFSANGRGAPAPAVSPADRQALAQTICDELTVHAQIEEEIFYPALSAASPEAAALVQAAIAEHDEAKGLIAQVRAEGEAGPALDELVAELNRAIEMHVKEERDDLFPKARAAPGLDLAALGAQMMQRQQEAKTEMPAG